MAGAACNCCHLSTLCVHHTTWYAPCAVSSMPCSVTLFGCCCCCCFFFWGGVGMNSFGSPFKSSQVEGEGIPVPLLAHSCRNLCLIMVRKVYYTSHWAVKRIQMVKSASHRFQECTALNSVCFKQHLQTAFHVCSFIRQLGILKFF